MTTTTKQCSACKALKDVSCYGSDASRVDGREHRCRACVSAKNREAYRRRKGALGAVYRARGWVAATETDGCQIN